MKQKIKDKPHLLSMKTIAAIIVGFLVVGLLAFSVQHYYERTEETGEREFFCVGEECFVTMHIHTEIEFDLCGEGFDLGREEAALEEAHTHKENNKLHWHAPLPADPQTQEILDYSNLTLENTFASLGRTLNSTCFENWCTGNTCNGRASQLTIEVNGVELAVEKEKYIWKDGDKILIKLG